MIAVNQGYGVVSAFRYRHSERISGYIFQDADADWLHCVVGNRRADTFPAVVEEVADDLRLDPTVTLKEFVASKTGALLHDEPSKLWWSGPSYIADMYKEEMQHGKM